MFSKPICANKARIGLPRANQGIATRQPQGPLGRVFFSRDVVFFGGGGGGGGGGKLLLWGEKM